MNMLLKECADLTLICNGGRSEVKANKFTILSQCSVLYEMHESVVQESLPLTNFSEHDVQLLVDILHKIVEPITLPLVDIEAAISIMEFVGCSHHATTALLIHMWRFITNMTSAADMIPYARRFVHHAAFRGSFLNRFVSLEPSWTAFSTLLSNCGHMTQSLATYILAHAHILYPTGMLIHILLPLLPKTTTSLHDILQIVGERRPGFFAHYAEIQEVVQTLTQWTTTCCSSCPDSKLLSPFLQFLADAFDVYDPVPSKKITGSSLMFSSTRKNSVLIDVSRVEGSNISSKITKWLTFKRKRRPVEDIRFLVDLRKTEWRARQARKVQFHILAVAKDSNKNVIYADMWHMHEQDDDVDVDEQHRVVISPTQQVVELLRLESLSRVHVNMFFNASPINQLVIFT